MTDLIVQKDGKIVSVGTSNAYSSTYGDEQFAVAKFDNNGWFDASFNHGRVLETGFGGNDRAFGVVQSADGNLVVGGSVNGADVGATVAGFTLNIDAVITGGPTNNVDFFIAGTTVVVDGGQSV